MTHISRFGRQIVATAVLTFGYFSTLDMKTPETGGVLSRTNFEINKDNVTTQVKTPVIAVLKKSVSKHHQSYAPRVVTNDIENYAEPVVTVKTRAIAPVKADSIAYPVAYQADSVYQQLPVDSVQVAASVYQEPAAYQEEFAYYPDVVAPVRDSLDAIQIADAILPPAPVLPQPEEVHVDLIYPVAELAPVPMPVIPTLAINVINVAPVNSIMDAAPVLATAKTIRPINIKNNKNTVLGRDGKAIFKADKITLDNDYLFSLVQQMPKPSYINTPLERKIYIHTKMNNYNKEATFSPIAEQKRTHAYGLAQIHPRTLPELEKQLGVKYPKGAKALTENGIKTQLLFSYQFDQNQANKLYTKELKRKRKHQPVLIGQNVFVNRSYTDEKQKSREMLCPVTLNVISLVSAMHAGAGIIDTYYDQLDKQLAKKKEFIVFDQLYERQNFNQYLAHAPQLPEDKARHQVMGTKMYNSGRAVLLPMYAMPEVPVKVIPAQDRVAMNVTPIQQPASRTLQLNINIADATQIIAAANIYVRNNTQRKITL